MTNISQAGARRLGVRFAGRLAASWRARRDDGAFATLDHPAARTRARAALDLSVLGGLGAALVALSLWAAHWRVLSEHPRAYGLTLGAQLAVYALASAWVVRRRPRAGWATMLILLVALAARLPFIPQVPATSDDIYRYVWDGRIGAAGINPYRYPPSDPALAPYRDDAVYPLINRKGVPTIYPPGAQGAFRILYAIHPDSIAWTKLALVGLDLLTIVAIAGLLPRLGGHPARAILYAWHPLLLYEVAHAGHLDVLTVLFLILAIRARVDGRAVRAGFLLACAALTKFYAVLALPALLDPRRRRDPRLPLALVATVALAYVPFLGVGWRVFGYLGGYVQEEGFASGERFYFLQGLGRLPGVAELAASSAGARLYTAALAAVMGALALWCWTRPLPAPRAIPARAGLLLAVFLTLSTPSYPWYALLVLALVPFAGRKLLPATILLTGAASFLYLQWWSGAAWPRHLTWGGTALALALAAIWPLVGDRVASSRRSRSRADADERAGADGTPQRQPRHGGPEPT